MKPIRIATRESLLAKWQAEHVATLLKDLGNETAFHYVKTTGDRIQDRYLHEVGGKGLFIKELEESLLAEQADIAVHSMKDLPARVTTPFEIVATLPRHDPRDVLILPSSQKLFSCEIITKDAAQKLASKRIATSSLRRQCYLRAAVKDITLLPLRGNVDTRVRKLLAGECDGIILAKAAMERLNMHQRPDITVLPFDPHWFVPCVSQGIISIEAVEKSAAGKSAKALNHLPTFLLSLIERQILAALGGDCTLPFGCNTTYTVADGKRTVAVRTVIIEPNGKEARAEKSFPLPLELETFKVEDLSALSAPIVKEVLAAMYQANANAVLRELKLEPLSL